MTPPDILDRAWELLRARSMRCSDLGWELWGCRDRALRCGSSGGNKYCRAAGKIVRRLERAGRAGKTITNGGIYWFAIRAVEKQQKEQP